MLRKTVAVAVCCSIYNEIDFERKMKKKMIKSNEYIWNSAIVQFSITNV